MGTLAGHLVPGSVLALLGLWHIINTIRSYHLKGPTHFRTSFWHPFTSLSSKFAHMELFLILFFSIFSITMQILDYPSFSFDFKLNNYEHATMFLHLVIYSGFTLLTELTHKSDILFEVSGILAASVFGQELFLLYYHSADHVGLEGHYHWLMQLIVIVSLLTTLTATMFPSSLSSSLVLSMSVTFQGFWFINMGFMLWVPELVPKGCTLRLGHGGDSDMHGAVVCNNHEAVLRARGLANLQFSWILGGIMIFVGCLCLSFPKKVPHRAQSIEYERLNSRVAEIPLSVAGFKQVTYP
uniref:Transmembrane protein 45B n=1 Tax=Tanacetum cinerariifolium TaxID=118510 RepID=A0A6L2JIS2_TANCI|nr:transmembrane protein 45B [Tanacetum cinerariifolium]